MVGGDAAGLELVRPVLDKLARSVFALGGPGAGTVAKLVNNQLYLCGEVLFFEVLVLAAKRLIAPVALPSVEIGAGVSLAAAVLAFAGGTLIARAGRTPPKPPTQKK